MSVKCDYEKMDEELSKLIIKHHLLNLYMRSGSPKPQDEWEREFDYEYEKLSNEMNEMNDDDKNVRVELMKKLIHDDSIDFNDIINATCTIKLGYPRAMCVPEKIFYYGDDSRTSYVYNRLMMMGFILLNDYHEIEFVKTDDRKITKFGFLLNEFMLNRNYC